MSKTAIVKTGEQFFIKQLSKSQPIKLDKVIFANINGINGDTEIDLNGSMPAASQIVHTAPVTQSGLLNDKTVVYSVILGTSVGDFSFNYIGLVNAETNTLCMVMHTDLTRKIKTAGQCQGNTITESIWLEIDNASESTGITVNAQTWQIDYSKRLAGEDERIRLTNYDLYNRLAIHNGFTITKNNNQLAVSVGLAYVAGLRVEHTAQKSVKVENNQSLYIDAWLAGTVTGELSVNYNLIAGTNLRDYDRDGFAHYVERIASVDADDNLIVVKPKLFITTYDHATTDKAGIVSLSSATNSTSEIEAATSKAVKDAFDYAKCSGEKAQSAYDYANSAHNRITETSDQVHVLEQFIKSITLPAGIPMPWPQINPPAGYFECNGSLFDVNRFPKLAVAYPSGFLPDLRGEFIRGWDNARGVDPHRVMLSWQNDAIRNITGSFTATDDNNAKTTTGPFYVRGRCGTGSGGGSQEWLIGFDASRTVPVSHDNHPRNIAFMYIVKAE
jgi:hypothetical protein